MHESAIAMSIMSIVLEHAKTAQAEKVSKINLTVGQLTGFVPECIELQLQMLGKGTIAEGAAVDFKLPPATLHCRPCNKDYSPDDFNLLCPGCGSKEFEIMSGRECFVDSIEVG